MTISKTFVFFVLLFALVFSVPATATIQTVAAQQVVFGNGVTTTFNVNFTPDGATDIAVIYTNSSGQQTTLSPTQYSILIPQPVTGQLWPTGFTLTYPITGSPIANGTSLTIQRLIPFLQTTNLTNQGNFYPQAVEGALDVGVMQTQQLAARTGSLRGTWITNTIYNVGDVVQDGTNGLNTQSYYTCAIANTSGTWTTDLGNGDWSLSLPATIPQTALPIPISDGGTGATSAGAALNNLGGISLSGNNTFTGANSFTGGSIIVPNRNAGDNSTNAASTAFVNGTALTLASGTSAVNLNIGSGFTFATPSANGLIVQGNVGIGTATPLASFEVYNSGRLDTYLDSNTTGDANVLHFISGNQEFSIGNNLTGSGSIFEIYNDTLGATAIDVSSGNEVSFNTTTVPLSGGQVGIFAGSGNTGLVIESQNTGSGIVITNISGTSTYNADVFYINGFSSAVGSISVSSGSTAFNTSSDARIKTNLVAVGTSNANGNIIDQLAPKTYNFIEAYDPDESVGEGFVAQQLYQVMPLAVTTGDATDNSYTPNDGVYKMWQVDLSKIVPQIVADMQWVHTLIAPLKSGVSCTAGSVNLSTLTVSGGVVTHC